MESRHVLAGTPIISEFLAGNAGGLQDADGDTSDWIEIYNPTAAAVNLQGWSLTNDPDDLNEWVFPSVTIAPNSFLTVFASDKNRTGPELHTNFKLSAEGDYLALVDPFGVVAGEYSPSYPPQIDNISYGVTFDTFPLIQSGAASHTLIPSSGALGDTWTAPGFNPVGWTAGTTGVGYGVTHPGFNILYARANASTFIDNLGVARNVLADPGLRSLTINTTAPYVNYIGAGGGVGRYASDGPFPNQATTDDINDFIVQGTGIVKIPTAGNWTFGVNSDDGFELRLERAGVVFTSEHFNPRGSSDTLATFNIPTAGDWNVSVMMYERGGGAGFEFFAAPGSHTIWNAAAFDLVGNTATGGLEVNAPIGTGTGADVAVGTDVRTAMQNVNATAYVRVPFNVSNPAAFDSLQLQMQYDDGFVAYLNGTEVARRNAPATLSYNSAATADRTLAEAVTAESINLTPFLSSLQTGTNVLAIRGLNSSAADDTFLVLPQLTGSSVHTDQLRYFSTLTPGTFNTNPAVGLIERVSSDVAAGFYNSPISVTLSTPSPGATIRYTTDGSTPTATNGLIYSAPLAISATTVLRAAAFRPSYLSMPSVSWSYLFLDDVILQSPSDDVAGGVYPDNGAPPPGWPATWGSNVVDYGIDQTIVNQHGAAAVKAALQSISTLSISTSLANLFDVSTGIYSNPGQDGRDWERDASVELINPDGSPGFQINAGLRIRGGYSRSTTNPKHSFRLFFRSEYGDSTLDYPVFGEEGADEFKKLDLRTAQNYSWSFAGDPGNTMIQDGFARESQGDMGQLYSHSRWIHLYLDGQYWGVYQIEERPEAEFASTYLGGDADNYDVIKPEAGPYTNIATDGNFDAYYRLWQFVTTQDLSNPANYYRLQGKNAAGANDPSIPNEDVLVDVDNLIVYMLGILHGGNLDAPISAFLGNNGINNYFAVRDRTGRSGFKFIQHDAEHTLRNVNENRNGPYAAGQNFDRFNPQFLHQQLMASAEYRLRFADLVQQFFFNDGPMTAANAIERFHDDAVRIDQAIIGESARWGDSKRPTSPLGRTHWLSAVAAMENFLANRNAILLGQFQANGLFPTVVAPQFLIDGVPQTGGPVDTGSELRMAAASGLVYYTTDGTDPRLLGGGINPAAMSYDPSSTQATLVAANSVWKYNDLGVDLGAAWRTSVYNDSAWASGAAELGYGDGDEATVVGYGPNANNKYITTYFRRNFSVTNAGQVSGLKLYLKRDDGAVVYINGVEAARSNMPSGAYTAATLAATNVNNGPDETTFYEFDLSPTLLVTGVNVIAIEVHQSVANSSDLTFDARLVATLQSAPALILNSSAEIQARTLSGGNWSPLSEAVFTTAVEPPSATNFVVTELHYNPAPEPGLEQQDLEWIEFRNVGPISIDLSGLSFDSGLTYDFASGDVRFLAPGEYYVLVKNRAAFEARYGNGIRIGGVMSSGTLDNGGERLRVIDASENRIINFVYDDVSPWATTPDGTGPSLVVRSITGDYNSAGNWRPSYATHGTPGTDETDLPPATLTLVGGAVDENVADAVAGTLSATDPNPNDPLTFSLIDNAGGRFILVGANLTLANGVTLDYEIQTSYSVTVRVTDSVGLTLDRTFDILVNDIAESYQVSTFTPTTTGARFTLNAPALLAALNLYDYRNAGGASVLGAADVQLTNGAGQTIPGSLIIAAGDAEFVFVASAGVLPPDTYTFTLRGAANGFQTTAGALLDGDANGVPGGDFVRTFTVTAPPVSAVTVSLPHFARGPEQAVHVPAAASLGLPINLSDGNQVGSLVFELQFDTGLLTISGVTLSAGSPPGSSASLTTLAAGRVRVTLTFGSPLAAGPRTVAYLQATVPTAAAARYGERETLDLSAVDLRTGGGVTIPALDQDSVHVNAYVGDLGRNGRYDSFDVQQASRVALRLDSGFQQHPLLDPALIADFNGNSRIDSFDVQRISRLALRLPVGEAPALPSPAPTTTDTDRVAEEETPKPQEAPAAETRSDVDQNGVIDAQDVLWVIYHFNRPSPNAAVASEVKADVNGDNQVDAADVLLAMTDVAEKQRKREATIDAEADDKAADDLDSLADLLAEDQAAASQSPNA